MTCSLISATLTLTLLATSFANAQPYPGSRGGLGPQGPNYGRASNGCFDGERRNDCRERLRVEQRSQHRYVYRDGRYEAQDSGGATVAAGILGFILGAAIAGSAQDRDYYAAHRNDSGWRARCKATYRSFDRGTGTYVGQDGYRHYCVR